jgi:hypothetical protein
MGDFKCDMESSDKQFGFVLPPIAGESDTVMVFESPIDALSHQTIFPQHNGWRLSLGGTSLAALTNFLDRHSEVRNVIVSTDNDKAGNIAAVKIADLSDIAVTRLLPPSGSRDWNDALNSVRNENKPSLIGRLEAAKAATVRVNSIFQQGKSRQETQL